jgi:ABC-type Na+ transport system ATPase subunit NatA
VVGVLEITKLEVNIQEGLYFPQLRGYGQMGENVDHFRYVFTKGVTYGLIGECGAGGWGLSYNLAGREHYISGEIKIDGMNATPHDLERIGWYVGEGIPSQGLFRRKLSVRQQLKIALKHNHHRKNFKIEEIIRLFNLSEDRLDMKLEQYSWEGWRASIAIGYAHGKQVFCFPWLHTSCINDLILNCGIHICIDILKAAGNIVILPTSQPESIDFFIDNIVPLENRRHMPSIRAREFVEEYYESKKVMDTPP